MPDKKSEKYQEAMASLPTHLQPMFDALVDDYYFYSTKHYGRGYVAYKVLAELIKTGWKCEEQPE